MWLEKDGETVFGLGIYRLLCLVEETGSLHQAAQRLQMSYRAAWGKVRDYERRLGVDLLEKGRHGRTGAHLTPAGKLMVERFGELQERMAQLVDEGDMSRFLSTLEHDIRED